MDLQEVKNRTYLNPYADLQLISEMSECNMKLTRSIYSNFVPNNFFLQCELIILDHVYYHSKMLVKMGCHEKSRKL